MSLSKVARLPFISLLVLLTVDLGACKSGSATVPEERATSESAAAPSPGTSPVQNARTIAKLPDYYPADAPVYPGASLSDPLDGQRVSVAFWTSDAVPDVIAWLQVEVEELGWELTLNRPIPELHDPPPEPNILLQAEKDRRKLGMIVSPNLNSPNAEPTGIIVTVDR